MEKVTLIFAVVTLGLGCQTVDRGRQLDDNKALVLRAHAEVWSGGNMAAADEVYAAEFVGHWTGRPDTQGREEFKAFVTDARAKFPNWNETVEQVVAEDNLVVTRFTSRGTFDGEPSHGKEVTMPEIAIHRIVDGKIVEQWTVADILVMRQQLGTLDTPVDDSASEP
ncbi:MAG: ester cyclase [Rhodothermia bacterium]|nr:MAG: ester cyclase [Rhodothermia bacterium]